VPVTLSLNSLPEEYLSFINSIKINAPSPEENNFYERLYNRLLVELHNLKYKYKVALTLYIKNYSYEEIAEVLKCRTGTAKSLVSRAKEKIKKNLIPFL